MARAYLAGLQNNVVTTYDKTKTTIAGNVFQKSINGQNVLGPGLTSFNDVQTQASITPSMTFFNPNTNRLFVLSVTSATPSVLLYNFNKTTGVYSYVGKIVITLVAGVHVQRGFKINDMGATWNIALSTTSTTLALGGTYVAMNLTLADFTAGGTTIYSAIATGAKAVYFLQDPAAVGSAHVASSSGGIAYPFASTNANINTKIYQQNGTAAAPVIYSWDLSTAPSVANTLTAVSSATTAYASTSPVAYFTSGTTNPGLVATDQVVMTVTAPANFTASTANAAQTIYYVRDVQLVSGSYYWNLATTSAGAAVVPTSAVSGITVMRAGGISTNTFSLKTGVLSPALTGTILQANSFGFCQPTSVPLNSALNGTDCFYITTSSNLYLFKCTDLTSLSTSWTSSVGANLLGTGSDIVAPIATNAVYSTELDRWVYTTSLSTYVVKQHTNNAISFFFGGGVNAYLEGSNPVTVQAGFAVLNGFQVHGGWLFVVNSTTTGQRGVIACDLRSDAYFNYSYVTSPVLNGPVNAVLKYIHTIEQLYDYTDSMVFQYKTAPTLGDATFSAPLTGWTTIATAVDESSLISNQGYFQLKILFGIATFAATTPAQINDLIYTLSFPAEMSDNFAMDTDSTTVGVNTPAYVAFVLTKAYVSLPTALYVRGYDLNGNQLFSDNTVSSPSLFSVSTDGVTFSAFTAISQLSTAGYKIRYNVATPPAQETLVSIRES